MKRNLIVYDTGRNDTTMFTMAFARGAMFDAGWQVRHVPINHYLKNGLDFNLRPGLDAVATLGILRGTGQMLKEAKSKGLNYFYIDHAYFNAGYGGKGWMRVVYNGHSVSRIQSVSSKRWKLYFKKNNIVEPWRNKKNRGDKIIICPPTHAVAWYLSIKYDWAEKVKSELEKILPHDQHHKIIIRPKPNEPVVDQFGNLVGLKKNPFTSNLNDELEQACVVIAYNSTVALDATLKGIPVITSDHSCCSSISFSIDAFRKANFPDLFDREPPNRISLLHWLSYNQWRMGEFNDGTSWRMLQGQHGYPYAHLGAPKGV